MNTVRRGKDLQKKEEKRPGGGGGVGGKVVHFHNVNTSIKKLKKAFKVQSLIYLSLFVSLVSRSTLKTKQNASL